LLADFVAAMLSNKFNLGDVVPVKAIEAEEEEAHDQAPMEEPKPMAVEETNQKAAVAEKPKKKAARPSC